MKISRLVALSLTLTAFGCAGKAPVAGNSIEKDEVTNEQMVELYRTGAIGKSAWVIDSRPEKMFNRGHIPGALSLPLDKYKKEPDSLAKLGIAKEAKLVFYCGGRECTLSPDSAELAKKAGYTNVWVFRNGIPGWNKKEQPLEVTLALIEKGNLILLDSGSGKTLVTPKNKTVQMSLADLKNEKKQAIFAKLSKNTPIVVLDRGGMKQVEAVFEELRFMDFRRLTYFPLRAWKGALKPAPKAKKLAWTPVYEPGQVAPKAFEEAVASGQMILDVRPAADYERGHFKGSVNLPVENIEKEFAKLPLDKPIYIHCATGVKSQKAFDILARKGYTRQQYLDAEVSCKGEACTVKE